MATGWTVETWVLFGLMVVFSIIHAKCIRAAYTNGVTDGYGYSKEPSCPGYAAAGEYLRRHMSHRWSELKSQ